MTEFVSVIQRGKMRLSLYECVNESKSGDSPLLLEEWRAAPI
jgi:hypothetical protein